ncbi:MAG: host attachment protein [Betaproteobacteria bacterium]|nr:host attachment protein [Betaproteobacteria bacterium]
MINTCIVVADGARARLFTVAEDASPRRKYRLEEAANLVNPDVEARGGGSDGAKSDRNTNRQAGPMHPIGAQRERHRLEQERRFGAQIVEQAVALVGSWSEGRLVLIADPRLLGLMRERLRRALKSEIRLQELAKDYSGLSVSELERLFVEQGVLA